MATPFDAFDWRKMSQQDLDLGLNNSVAVAGSADIVAGWDRQSAAMRERRHQASESRFHLAQRPSNLLPMQG